MYALIIVIGMLSQGAGSAVMPVGVTSQIVGKFKNLDECKAAAGQPHAGGPISDLSLSTTWGVNWYCHIHRGKLAQCVCQGEARMAFGIRAPAAIHCS